MSQLRSLLIPALTVSSLLVLSGCTREWYRRQADEQAGDVIAEKNGRLDYSTIDPHPDSRLFDAFDRDHPALPPDDPTSHQLMHEVDGHSGYAHWHDNGDAEVVDDRHWMADLPTNDSGEVVLNLQNCVQLARLHSRDYQRELEDLYLSALGVTFERFRFNAQFFAGNSSSYNVIGDDRPGGSRSILSTNSDVQVRQLTATGGELIAGLANSIVWQFSGGDTEAIGSIANFSLVQPLLRFGGRARVLERLTQSERTLLANVRQMEQYRQGFYVTVTTGRNSGEGPSVNAPVGASGLGLLAGTPGTTGSVNSGSLFGLLQTQQQIRNQASNVAALKDSLAQLEAAFDAGRIPIRLQVDQARQALYNSQSSLLAARSAFQTAQEGFAITIGLPPWVPLRIQDPILSRFNLLDPELTALQEDAGTVLTGMRSSTNQPGKPELKQLLANLLELRERIADRANRTTAALDELETLLPARIEHLELIRTRLLSQGVDVDARIYQPDSLKQRVQLLRTRFPRLNDRIATLWKELTLLRDNVDEAELADSRSQAIRLTTDLSGRLLEMALIQAEARLEAISLVPIDMRPEDGMELARNNRLDWMNARARLVDSWRQIEFTANPLLSGLNVTSSGNLGTRGNNPVDFNAENSQLTFGLEFDTPITRLAERNDYRTAQINYQRARRDFMLFEDRLLQSVRNTLRITELSQLNFEIRRAAVRVAISQVELSRERLNAPPRPGEANQFSPTTARDLVSALSDLLNSQNDLLNTWVGYEVIRVLLDFELGTMRLDDRGMWLDPGPIVAPSLEEPAKPEDSAQPDVVSLPDPKSPPL